MNLFLRTQNAILFMAIVCIYFFGSLAFILVFSFLYAICLNDFVQIRSENHFFQIGETIIFSAPY